MDTFDRNYRGRAEWVNWTENKSHRFAVVRNDQVYPSKMIVSLATGIDRGRFSGGMKPGQAGWHIRRAGLDVIDLRVSTRAGGITGVNNPAQGAQQRYWAFVADPHRYRIRDAVAKRSRDTWTTKGKPIRVGDQAIIWQARDSRGCRGVVALAQVAGRPRLRSDAGNPYWVNPTDGNAITERVGVRYIRIAKPLWMGGLHDDILAPLSVSRAHGGTVFHLTADQWKTVESFALNPRRVTDAEEVASDIDQLRRRKDLSPTQRESFIQARLGQGGFRRDLLKYWSGCAVVGCTAEAVLRASHIKPWKKSSDRERLDPANGLLLIANLDALFNDGLITFDDHGRMLISDQVASKDRSLLRLGGRLKKPPSPRQRKYLRFHREKEFHQ
jgi:hypothetical protein